METLQITVDRVLYPREPINPADTPPGAVWYVLATSAGKCTGEVAWRPREGEALTLTGRWGAYQGERNFRFTSALPNIPIDPRDLLRYAVSRTPGIGPALEDTLWDALGDTWRDAIAPGVVPRYTETVHCALCETLAELDREAAKTQAIGLLMARGCTDKMALAAWAQWGANTVSTVTADPFALATLTHFSFATVDQNIRHRFEIGDDDPRRTRAGILHALRQRTASGDTVTPWATLGRDTQRLLGGYGALITEAARAMLANSTLIGLPETQEIAAAVDYEAEEAIYRWAAL